ncbi:MAG: membrane protein insertion efficiency factor YidD [Candidatus Omnitrophica bacterium]|nr:membrane protein insertion efficiency factor YidD [Candidatus Omnitrophota bacterium]
MSKKIVLCCIDFYRNYLSGMMLPRCRFYPTCSAYAREAINKKGFLRGSFLSIRRLMRCHPFSKSNFYDPVK